MTKIRMSTKRFVALIACAVALVLALIAVPAYALYYVHGGDYETNDSAQGAFEILCTIDQTAQGGRHATKWSGLIFVPAGGTAETALNEAIHSSESQQGLKAIHNYDYKSYADYINKQGGTWKVTVYHAESQKPGTQTTEDNRNKDAVTVSMDELNTVTLQRYDRVVATYVKK